MREYGQIQSAFWQSDVAACSDGAKLLACYLLTGPQTNGVGCFLLGDGYIQEDHPSWTKADIEKRFDELSRNGFAYRFERVVYMPKFLTWNTIANGNIARARFLDWVAIPRGLMRQCAAVSMLALSGQWRDADKRVLEDEKSLISEDLYKGLPNGSLNGLRNGLANLFLKLKNQHPTPPHPITPRETDVSLVRKVKKTSQIGLSDPNLSPKFCEFWELYPRKEQRAKAAIAYAKLAPSAELHQTILDALGKQRETAKWKFEPQFVPHPTTWLNGKRWEDDIESISPTPSPIPSPLSKTRQGIENLMRGVNGHEPDRTGNPTRLEQAGLLELGSNTGDGHARRNR